MEERIEKGRKFALSGSKVPAQFDGGHAQHQEVVLQAARGYKHPQPTNAREIEVLLVRARLDGTDLSLKAGEKHLSDEKRRADG